MTWLETCRGSVLAWEVDNVGHFTVAYYFQRFEDAGLALLDALGLGPAHARDGRQGCLTADAYVRYLHELRAGDIHHVLSGVIATGESELRLGHKLLDSATDTVCATVEQQVVHVDLADRTARAFPAAQRAAAEARRVEWDGPARERRAPPRPEAAFVEGLRDTVKPWEIGVLGQAALSHYIHRFSHSGGHLMAAFGMSPAYMREQDRGLSTFEFQLAITGPLLAGDLVCVQTALAHVGHSSLRLFHRMANARTGAPLATLEQSGVHLDRAARRPAPLPDALRARAKTLL